jgi:hypothetical protein
MAPDGMPEEGLFRRSLDGAAVLNRCSTNFSDGRAEADKQGWNYFTPELRRKARGRGFLHGIYDGRDNSGGKKNRNCSACAGRVAPKARIARPGGLGQGDQSAVRLIAWFRPPSQGVSRKKIPWKSFLDTGGSGHALMAPALTEKRKSRLGQDLPAAGSSFW